MPSEGSSLEVSLSRASATLLRPASAFLAVAYAVLATGHLFLLEGAARLALASCALGTALVACCVLLLPGLRGGARADAALGALAILAWANSTLHLTLEPEIRHTTNFAIVLFGIGLLITRRHWFYPLLLLSLATWGVLVLALEIDGAQHWAWMLSMVAGVAVVAHELRRELLRQDLDREALLRRHARELQVLVQSPELAGPRPEPVFERIIEAARRVLGVERAGIWLLSPDGERITLAALRDRRGPEAEAFARTLERSKAPAYFAALGGDRILPIEDAIDDARTRELAATYLVPLDVGALLDTPILAGGRLAGVLCIEHRGGVRSWSLQEQSFAASLADFAAVALQAMERAELEQRTQTAERLESLGLLAGGVAHDFNNLLTAVIGNAELLLMRPALAPDLRRDIEHIVQAAQQAADLSRQMLTYTGRGTIEPHAVDLGRTVTEYLQSRSIGADGTRVEFAPADRLPSARADAVQVVQILRNLISNAVDAGARRVVLRTGLVELDAQALASRLASDAAQPGRFVFLEAEDDGSGMDPDTARYVFDPFFTTKRLGQGLGLAAALGTMRMHGGAIELETAEGAGSRFRFLFPVAAEVARPARPRPSAATEESARRRSIVVDDEPLVLDLIGRTLEGTGRRVEAFASCGEFEQRFPDLPGDELDVAIIDLSLPDGSGLQLAAALRERFATLPIVLVSGFDEHGGLAEMLARPHVVFLLKPFRPRELLEAIERAVRTDADTVA